MSDIVYCKDCVYSEPSNLTGNSAELFNFVYCTYYKHNISIVRGCGNGKPKPHTNADRIRNMTDEELARWIHQTRHNPLEDRNYREWLEWLKQEYKNGQVHKV